MRRVSEAEAKRKGAVLRKTAREEPPKEVVLPPMPPSLDAASLAEALSQALFPLMQRDDAKIDLLVQLMESTRNTEEVEAPPEVGETTMMVHRSPNTNLINSITIGDEVVSVNRNKQTGFIESVTGEDTTAVVERDPQTGMIVKIAVVRNEPTLN